MQGDDARGLYDHYPHGDQLYGPRTSHMAEDQQPWPNHGSTTHRGLTNPPSDSTANKEPRQQTSVQLPGYTDCTSPSYALGHGGQKPTNQPPESVATTPRQSTARVDWLDGIPPMDIAANRAYPIGEAGTRWGRLKSESSGLVPRSFYPEEQGFAIPADPGHSHWRDRDNIGEGSTIRSYTELGPPEGPFQGELTRDGNARGVPREMTQEPAGGYDRTLRPTSSTSTSTSTSASALITLSRRRSSVPYTSARITSASASAGASCDDHHEALVAAAAAAAGAATGATATENNAKEYAANVSSNAIVGLHTASELGYFYAPVSPNYNITNINHNKNNPKNDNNSDDSSDDIVIDDSNNDDDCSKNTKTSDNNIRSARQNPHQYQYPHAHSYADAHYNNRSCSPSRPVPSTSHNTGATTHSKHYPYLKSCDHSPASSTPCLGPSPLPHSPPFNLYDTARAPVPVAYREMLDIDPETKDGRGLGLGPHYALESNLRSTIKMEPVSLEYQDLQKIPMAPPPPKPRAGAWLMHVGRDCRSSKEPFFFSRSMPNLAPQSITASASSRRIGTLVREAPASICPTAINQSMQSVIAASAVTPATTSVKSPVVQPPPLSELNVSNPPKCAIDKVQAQAQMTCHESHAWHLQQPQRDSPPRTKSVEVLPRGSTIMSITELGAGGPSTSQAGLPGCGSDNGQTDRQAVLSGLVYGKFSDTELETSRILTEMSRQPLHSSRPRASSVVATIQSQQTSSCEDTEMVDQQTGDCDQTQDSPALPPSPPIVTITNPFFLNDCAKLIRRYIGSGYAVADGPPIANKMSALIEDLAYHAMEMLRVESRFTSAALKQWVLQNPKHEGYTCMTKMANYLGKISFNLVPPSYRFYIVLKSSYKLTLMMPLA